MKQSYYKQEILSINNIIDRLKRQESKALASNDFTTSSNCLFLINRHEANIVFYEGKLLNN